MFAEAGAGLMAFIQAHLEGFLIIGVIALLVLIIVLTARPRRDD